MSPAYAHAPQYDVIRPEHVEKARRLAIRKAGGFPALAHQIESDAIFALCEAAQTYDPDKNPDFWQFARSRVQGSILDALRKHGTSYRVRLKNFVPTYSFSSIQGKNPKYDSRNPYQEDGWFVDSREDPIGESMAREDELRRLFAALPPSHGRVMTRLYLHADTRRMKAAGKALGISEGRVSQIHAESVEMLREQIARHAERESAR